MSRESLIETLDIIIEDMKNDAASMDKAPFDGRTVGEYFGKTMAGVAGVANLLKLHLEEDS